MRCSVKGWHGSYLFAVECVDMVFGRVGFDAAARIYSIPTSIRDSVGQSLTIRQQVKARLAAAAQAPDHRRRMLVDERAIALDIPKGMRHSRNPWAWIPAWGPVWDPLRVSRRFGTDEVEDVVRELVDRAIRSSVRGAAGKPDPWLELRESWSRSVNMMMGVVTTVLELVRRPRFDYLLDDRVNGDVAAALSTRRFVEGVWALRTRDSGFVDRAVWMNTHYETMVAIADSLRVFVGTTAHVRTTTREHVETWINHR